jgi:hypothetical protein
MGSGRGGMTEAIATDQSQCIRFSPAVALRSMLEFSLLKFSLLEFTL